MRQALIAGLAAIALLTGCGTEPEPLKLYSGVAEILNEPGMLQLADTVCDAYDSPMTLNEIRDVLIEEDLDRFTVAKVMKAAAYTVCPEHRSRLRT